ncbi:MAG TPA: hypothetical protein VF723_06495 [Pyrinomonadaceae bacterium]
MLSRPRSRSLSAEAIARIVWAVLLSLGLLAGALPPSAFSFSADVCRMDCCLGKSPHAPGSCSIAFADEAQAEPPGELTGDAAATDKAMHEGTHVAHAAARADGSPHAGGAAKQSSESMAPAHHSSTRGSRAGHHSSSTRQTARAASVVAAFLAKPCSPECAAAALSSPTGGRRPRDGALLNHGFLPRAPSRIANLEWLSGLVPLSTGARGVSVPRGPPILLTNPST